MEHPKRRSVTSQVLDRRCPYDRRVGDVDRREREALPALENRRSREGNRRWNQRRSGEDRRGAD